VLLLVGVEMDGTQAHGGTSPDAIAVITGISSSTSVGNIFAAAPSLTIISGTSF